MRALACLLLLTGLVACADHTWTRTPGPNTTTSQEKSQAYRLTAAPGPAPTGHVLKGAVFQASRDAGWTPADVEAFSAHLPRRLNGCGIALDPVLLVFGATESEAPGASLVLRFVERIEAGADGTIGGRAFAGRTPPLALIARRTGDGRLYAPEQTVAHEVGHLLGLGHTAGGIDLMSPRGCLFCKFSAVQCARLRAHPLVRPRQ